LLFLTGFTVFLSYVDFGSQHRNIVIALLVAAFKVSLVGAVFMHLKGERPTIWRFLYFTAFFVLGLFLLTWFHWADPIFGTTQNVH
jgi:caa(3)-type oxidase subunit IV